jgi:type VII secretion-associated serine protease mycosin
VSVLIAALVVLAAADPAAAAPGRQWTLDSEHFDGARLWQLSKGDGVIVAVVDGGVDAHHPDLIGRVLPGADFTGYAVDGRRDVSADGHGTSVAGIIAGSGSGPAGSAVSGIAPRARILPVRVADGAASSLTALAQGIDYASTHGAKVINVSTCTPVSDPQVRAAVAAAVRRDVVVVAAAGNDGLAANSAQYPAALPGVLAVAASDVSGARWPKSESGGYIALTAPGVDIYTTGPDGGYVSATGTSFAAPQVSGVAALLRARFPAENAVQIVNRLTGTATSGGHGRTAEGGYGLIDPYRALTAAPFSRTENNLLAAPPPASVPAPGKSHLVPLVAAVLVAAVLLVAAATALLRRRQQS